MSGWGFTAEYKEPSEILKHLQVPLVTRSECEKHISEDFERYLTDDKICAGFLNSSKFLTTFVFVNNTFKVCYNRHFSLQRR